MMTESKRDELVARVQEALPSAEVLDVFSAQGWAAICVGRGAPSDLIPIKCFVKTRPWCPEAVDLEPVLAVAMERPDGRLVVDDGFRTALVGVPVGEPLEDLE